MEETKVNYLDKEHLGKVQYEKRELKLKKQAGGIHFINHTPPSKANNEGAEDNNERCLIDGEDRREPVVPRLLRSFPYSAVVQLHFQLDRPYSGSGIVVGPHHVLTTAHNVYDDEFGWAKDIK